MAMTRWGVLVALALVLPGCGGSRTPADGEAATPGPQDPAFVASTEQWREARRERLLEPDGWASLVGLHWIELNAHYLGSGATNGIRLAKGPEKLGLLQQSGGRVFLVPERGVALTVDGEPLKGRIELLPDTSDTPSTIGFDDGAGQLSLLQRSGRKALRVRHADADTRVRFGTLDYWPADAGWRIDATFVPHPEPRTLEIMDITSQTQALPNPGVVEFERGGVRHRLEALQGTDGGLFLVFADRTSGHESYGPGRYLDTAAPEASGTVVVDFNRAYNPPCAFTDYATCPLPPPGNRLDLAVTAGEKRYTRPN
jgi:uncharacterized protein